MIDYLVCYYIFDRNPTSHAGVITMKSLRLGIRRYWPDDAPSEACSFGVRSIVYAWYDFRHLVGFGTIATDQEGDGDGWGKKRIYEWSEKETA